MPTLPKCIGNSCVRVSLICFLLIFSFGSLFAQTIITGRVINHNDKRPIANASIFLSNTTVGNQSAHDGYFMLKGVKAGKYQIIVSVVGFKTYNTNIVANGDLIELHDIELAPEVKALKEVSIRYKADPDRELYLKWFKEQFLGTSELASDCVLINPEVLDFEYDKNKFILSASSYDFLNIENKDLGFRLKYLVKDFSYCTNPALERPIQYQGFVLFEEMKGTPGQENRWKRNRQDAYEGSQMHFFRSLVSNRLNEEGFRVLQWAIYKNPERPPDSVIESKVIYFKKLTRAKDKKKYTDSLKFWENKRGLKKVVETLMNYPLNEQELVKLTDQKDMYALGCDMDNLHITYNKDLHFSKKGLIYHLDEPSNRESSVLSFSKPYAFFDNNGVVLNINSISLSGVWARNRVAELLPYDYEPESFSAALTQQDTLKVRSKAFYRPDTLEGALLQYARYSDSLTNKQAAEKLYLQLDKQDYAIGDTIWLKAYLFNAASHLLSSHSGLLHIALVNDSGKVAQQALLQFKDGLSWGNIGLSAKEFGNGDYTLIAYTNWMMNFGQDVFFRKRIRIAAINENTWLINSRIDQGKDLIDAKVQITGIDKVPYADSVMRVEITENRKRVYSQLLKTDRNGLVDLKFAPPTKANKLNIKVVNKGNTKGALIPVPLNHPENTDVQFMAEGGDLVAGLKAHVGFKAVGEDGKGADIKGSVVDGAGKQVAVFSSAYKGIGSFDWMPEDGATYTARIELSGGVVKDYALPSVKRSGTVLQVKNAFKSDSVEVNIFATASIVQLQKSYFLIGKARGVICYAATVRFTKDAVHQFVPKHLFPSGITHFILSSTDGRPLNERLIFINQDDNLNIKVNPDETMYASRDSVALHLDVTKQNGDPAEGSFSLAVTDDEQTRPDSLNTDNILTRMLLTADLKGYVENPGYYFRDHAASFTALDNLLLTQGWVSYEYVAGGKPVYLVETEFTVNGNVKNLFGNPVKKNHVLLFSKSPFLLKDTLTNDEGKFLFNHFPTVDTAIFILKSINKRGGSANVNITIEDKSRSVFDLPKISPAVPWYINSDSALMHLLGSKIAYENRGDTLGGRHHLKEVVIKAKKAIKGSQNLNGPGNADMVLDEKDLEGAGKKTWLQLLKENLHGFSENIFDIGGSPFSEKVILDRKLFSFVTDGKGDGVPQATKDWYYINGKPIKFIIDGTPVYQIYQPVGVAFTDITDYLKSHTAEDIKGIEVLSSTKYAMKYLPSEWAAIINISDVAFVEITTRSGHGPVIDNTPGMYLYKPVTITRPAQFYKPKYGVKEAAGIPDYRSTIDWEPNIITDQNGKATVSFYAADKASTYTIIMEGTDANGNIGYKRQKIVIHQKKIEAKSK